ncbi:MAG: hypothetical protein ACK41T_01090 [Pseudobdellovibrio sp.]
MNTVEAGRLAFQYFFEASKKFSNFTYSFESMLEIIAGSPKAVQILLDGLGTSIIEIKKDGFLSDSKVKAAMTNLANVSKGQLPNRNYFFSALSQEAQNVTFVDAVPSVVSGTLKELATGAQAIGDSLIDTGKILTWIFPFVAVISILFITKEKVKKVAK